MNRNSAAIFAPLWVIVGFAFVATATPARSGGQESTGAPLVAPSPDLGFKPHVGIATPPPGLHTSGSAPPHHNLDINPDLLNQGIFEEYKERFISDKPGQSGDDKARKTILLSTRLGDLVILDPQVHITGDGSTQEPGPTSSPENIDLEYFYDARKDVGCWQVAPGTTQATQFTVTPIMGSIYQVIRPALPGDQSFTIVTKNYPCPSNAQPHHMPAAH